MKNRWTDHVFVLIESICENPVFLFRGHPSCSERKERMLLTLQLQRWSLTEFPYLKLSDFNVVIQDFDVKTDEFINVELVFKNHHLLVRDLVTKANENNLRQAVILVFDFISCVFNFGTFITKNCFSCWIERCVVGSGEFTRGR